MSRTWVEGKDKGILIFPAPFLVPGRLTRVAGGLASSLGRKGGIELLSHLFIQPSG